MFYEANKNKLEWLNDFIWKLNCVFSRYIFRTLLSNKSIFSSIITKCNIFYKGILKHRKYRFWFFCIVFYLPWIVKRELSATRFDSKSCFFLCDIIIYHLPFIWCLLNVDFLTTIRFVNITRIHTGELHWFLWTHLGGM